MNELLQDTHVWFAISFAGFVVVAFVFGRGAILGKLDARIAEIRKEIQTAEALNEEARLLLAEYETKHADAVRMAAKIKDDSERAARALQADAEANLAQTLERRERQLEERLAQMKQSAIGEIQQYAADLAAAATAEIIAKKLDTRTNEQLISRAIDALPGTLPGKLH